MASVKLKNANVVTEQGLNICDVFVRDGIIDLTSKQIECDETIDLAGAYVLPGFIDIHFHGYGGFSFTAGKYDIDKGSFDASDAVYESGFDMLSRTLAQFGVAGYYISTWAAAVERLQRCYGLLADYMDKRKKHSIGTKLLGGLLEGCFFKPELAGAQNPEYLLEPDEKAFDKINEAGSIKLVNVAPDFGQASIRLTEYLTRKDIIVGAGHTNATCEQFERAVKAGLKYCIHFTNGPTGGSYKPFDGGGAIEAVLKSNDIYAELIADGYHINPAYIRDIIARKGVERIIGITDAAFFAGTKMKQVNMHGVLAKVSDNGQYIRVVGRENTLASSNLTMDRAFGNMLNWLTSDMEGIWNQSHKAVDFEQAMMDCARIYSTNPCELLGLTNDGFGRITDGAKADICVLDISGSQGNYKTEVKMTVVDGKIVYTKD